MNDIDFQLQLVSKFGLKDRDELLSTIYSLIEFSLQCCNR